MEGDLTGRKPQQKMTPTEDDLNERLLLPNKTSMEDEFNDRRPQWKKISTEDNLNGR